MTTEPAAVFKHGNYMMSAGILAALVVIFVVVLAPRDNAVLWAAAYFPLIALHLWLLTSTSRIRLDGETLGVHGLRAANRWEVPLADIRSVVLQPPGLKRGAAWQIRVNDGSGEKQAYIARMSPIRMQQLQALLGQRLGERYHGIRL